MKATAAIIMTLVALVAGGTWAESITHGGTTINMDFVNIGYAGNVADTADGDGGLSETQRYGSVGYNYRIGKFEVTASQWASVIAADSRVGHSGSWSGEQPIATLDWWEAAKFSNWLTTGDAYAGAYKFDGSGLIGVDRAAAVDLYGTVYVIPTEDEWYKAAYFKSDGSGYTRYPTGDSVPIEGIGGANFDNFGGSPWNVGTGIIENNGTFDMGGNVWEWNESAWDGNLDNMSEVRVMRGGMYYNEGSALRSSWRSANHPLSEDPVTGFRMAVIPEPASLSLIGLVTGGIYFVRRFFPAV